MLQLHVAGAGQVPGLALVGLAHVDHLLDVTELADRKTRFALVILGALNAVNVLIAIRAPELGADALSPVVLQSYVASYVLLSAMTSLAITGNASGGIRLEELVGRLRRPIHRLQV